MAIDNKSGKYLVDEYGEPMFNVIPEVSPLILTPKDVRELSKIVDYETRNPPDVAGLFDLFLEGGKIDPLLATRVNPEHARNFIDAVVAHLRYQYPHDEEYTFGNPELVNKQTVYKLLRAQAILGRPEEIAHIHSASVNTIRGYPQTPIELGQLIGGAYSVRSSIAGINAPEAKTIKERKELYMLSRQDENRADLLRTISGFLGDRLLSPGEAIVLNNQLIDEMTEM